MDVVVEDEPVGMWVAEQGLRFESGGDVRREIVEYGLHSALRARC